MTSLPDETSKVQKVQAKQNVHHDTHSKKKTLSVVDKVFAAKFGRGYRWDRDTILSQTISASVIKTLDGQIIHIRHLDHLKQGYTNNTCNSDVILDSMDTARQTTAVISQCIVFKPVQYGQVCVLSLIKSHYDLQKEFAELKLHPGNEFNHIPVESGRRGGCIGILYKSVMLSKSETRLHHSRIIVCNPRLISNKGKSFSDHPAVQFVINMDKPDCIQ